MAEVDEQEQEQGCWSLRQKKRRRLFLRWGLPKVVVVVVVLVGCWWFEGFRDLFFTFLFFIFPFFFFLWFVRAA